MQENIAIIRRPDGTYTVAIIKDTYPAAVSDDTNRLGDIALVIGPDGRMYMGGKEVESPLIAA